MLPETVELETLRQKIEALQTESGDRSDYLDYGKPTPAQIKQTNETLKKLDGEIKTAQEELKHAIDIVRAQNPQAIEEWTNYHIALLQTIIAENSTDKNAGTRKYVAKETIQNWEKVRTGELHHVNINGYFLKAYKNHVRSFNGNSKIGETLRSSSGQAASGKAKSKDKAWWQFWK